MNGSGTNSSGTNANGKLSITGAETARNLGTFTAGLGALLAGAWLLLTRRNKRDNTN